MCTPPSRISPWVEERICVRFGNARLALIFSFVFQPVELQYRGEGGLEVASREGACDENVAKAVSSTVTSERKQLCGWSTSSPKRRRSVVVRLERCGFFVCVPSADNVGEDQRTAIHPARDPLVFLEGSTDQLVVYS